MDTMECGHIIVIRSFSHYKQSKHFSRSEAFQISFEMALSKPQTCYRMLWEAVEKCDVELCTAALAMYTIPNEILPYNQLSSQKEYEEMFRRSPESSPIRKQMVMDVLELLLHKVMPVSYTHLTLPTKRIV